MEPLDTDADPRVVGPFHLLARLGRGGMGIAYLAREIPPDAEWDDLAGGPDDPAAAFDVVGPEETGGDGPRLVAVKMIKPSLLEGEPRARERFGREIDAVRAVVSDRVPALIAFEEDPAAARPWFAMDYVPGPSLQTMVREAGTFGIGPYAALGLALVDALRAIHGAGLLHRDLKPANVVLGPDGPVVLDFGLAVLTERASSQAITSVGAGLGTKGYMPLEQLRDARHVKPSADVYALGATLFYAAAGRPPFPDVPLSSDPNWDGVAAPFLPLLAKTLAPFPVQRPDLDAVERGLIDLLLAADLTPQMAAEQLRAFVASADLTPQLPPEALTDEVDPVVLRLAREAADAVLTDVDPGFFGIVDTDEIERAVDAERPADTERPADPEPAAPGPPPPVPAPVPAAATSYRLPPPRRPGVRPAATSAKAPPGVARKVAADLRERYAHRGTL